MPVSIYPGPQATNPDDPELALEPGPEPCGSPARPQNAIAVISQLIGKQGRTRPCSTELGKAYLAADQDNLALPTLLEAKGQAPNDWEILSTLGVAL